MEKFFTGLATYVWLITLDMLYTSNPAILDFVCFSLANLIYHDLNRTKEDGQSDNFKEQKLGTKWKANMYVRFTPFVWRSGLLAWYRFGGSTKIVVDIASVADYLTEFQGFAEYLMEEDGLEPPSNTIEALNLYTYLLQK